jgi:hypothetical protein
MATIDLGRVGFVNKGAYSGIFAYKLNDVVVYNSGTYACIQANTGQLPTATAYWQVWVSNDKAPLDSPALVNPTINGVAQSGYSGFKNHIINGKKVINQRATFSTDNSYNQDRWYKSGNNWTQGVEYLSLTPNATYTISWVGSATCTYVFSTDSTANNSWDNVGTMVSVTNGGTITAPSDVFSGSKHLFIRFASDSTGSTFNYVQLEEGSVATPFEQRPYGEELSLCQRYYFKTDGRLQFSPYSSDGATRRFTYMLPSTMRVSPSVSNITNTGFSTAPTLLIGGTSSLLFSGIQTTTTSSSYVSSFTADAEL